MNKLKSIGTLLLLVLLVGSLSANAGVTKKSSLKNKRVLVYTKNGKGYVHDNIPSAVASIQKLGVENKFQVDVSDDPAVFTAENLNKYTMLIFPSTNNDIFDNDLQRLAFRRYIEAGGGFVGIHSVTGTERKWEWFKQLIGGTFAWHPKNQVFTVRSIKPEHPSLRGIPKVWDRKDECYFTREFYPGINVIMAHDVSTLNQNEKEKIDRFTGSYGHLIPAVWYQQFDGGNMWLTTLGHDKETYQDPMFLKHILQGIEYVASVSKKLDYNKAYAQKHDESVRY